MLGGLQLCVRVGRFRAQCDGAWISGVQGSSVSSAVIHVGAVSLERQSPSTLGWISSGISC